jgi:DNA-binding GntR family transcriptional regulator
MALKPRARAAAPTDRIAEQIRSRILSGELAGGVPLRQERIALEFGVSRIPVREALSRLEAEGLVRREHHRGCIVSEVSLADLEESLEIRSALEVRALRLAIPRMTQADLAEAQRVLERYAASKTPAQWTERNLEFHLALYRAAGMPRLLDMIEGLIRGTARYVRVYVSTVRGLAGPHQEHQEILAACRGRDVALAAQLLEAHIEKTRTALRASLATGEP